MANDTSTAGLRHLSTLFSTGITSSLSDAQLLERIQTTARAASAAEAAFATLMARHGPMVLGVCRRALNDPRDVEDAFQATFVVLVRKSGVVRVDDSLGRWLYGVARRVAHRARTLAEKRRGRETTTLVGEPALSPPDIERAELLAALDDELGRLPEKYRVPVLLCDLEGLTHTEAASRLQWPLGTVKGRLAQARSLLKERLTRRGLAPHALALGAILKAEARLAVPAHLAERTVRSALSITLGGQTAATLASASVIALSRGALRAMLFTKLKLFAVGLLTVLGMTAGAGILANAGHRDSERTSNRQSEPRGASSLPEKSSGDRRPTNAVAIVSDVESDTEIVTLAPEGSKVRKGDLVCQLDSSALEEKLAKLSRTTSRAKSAFQEAKRKREAAEIALNEYKTVIYKTSLQELESEIRLADAEREHAEKRLEWSDKVWAQGYISKAQNADDKIALQRKVFAYEQAQSEKNILEKYTYTKTVKSLKSELEQAQSEEKARELLWKRAEDQRAKLENQIKHCRIVSPVSGILEYARWPVPGTRGQFTTVEKGATVRWAQLLFWILPTSDRSTHRAR